MSTPGGYHEYTRDLGTNEKRPLPNFQDFCSCTFCDYAVVHVGLWNIRQLVKISLSGSHVGMLKMNEYLCSFYCELQRSLDRMIQVICFIDTRPRNFTGLSWLKFFIIDFPASLLTFVQKCLKQFT